MLFVARRVSVEVERWPVAGVFNIARGAKRFVDVVVVSIDEGAFQGRGEATAIYYHGESAEGVQAQVVSVAAEIEGGAGRHDLYRLLPRGAARNAVDSALWDLEAKSSGRSVHDIASLPAPEPAITAYTLSLAEPAEMEIAARQAGGRYPLLKLKLAGEGDEARVAAVHRGAPEARIIVDANEAWTELDVASQAAALVPYGVELIEQPVRAGQDHLLDGITSPIPLCADESCQDRSDLARCAGRYSAINIKLDKAGGLTEAIALAREARASGLDVMVGCMLSTSLGVAPAFQLAGQAKWLDLDGPLLLASDRADGFRFDGGIMHPASARLWG